MPWVAAQSNVPGTPLSEARKPEIVIVTIPSV
jgi:hypothetical protein